MDEQPTGIVVGLCPQQSSSAALEYAVVEAARRGCGLHLVAVEQPTWGAAGMYADLRILDRETQREDLAFLTRCRERARRWSAGDAEVTMEVAHGGTRRRLADVAEHAELVVLQHHRMGHAAHLPLPSVTDTVAGRVLGPVVAVPDDWRESDTAHQLVVAGVTGLADGGLVAEAAFAAASRGEGQLLLLHAWRPEDKAIGDELHLRAQRRHDDAHAVLVGLRRDFAPMLAAHGDVTCRISVVAGPAEYALMKESARSRLVVVGRHRRRGPLSPRLGAVAHTVLDHAHCPVMVVDPGAEEATQTGAPGAVSVEPVATST